MSSRFSLSSWLENDEDQFFPATVSVVGECEEAKFAPGTLLDFMFVEAVRAVKFRDGSGLVFNELSNFKGCYFQRLPDDPTMDDKMFLTASNVLEKPSHVRPRMVSRRLVTILFLARRVSGPGKREIEAR